MLTEEELRYLLSVSYSNNDALYSIDQKIRENKELIDNLNILLNMRDVKEVWTKTTINMVITSFLATGVAHLAFDLSNKDTRTMLLSLSIGSLILGYVKYKEDVARQKKVREIASENDRINTFSTYSIEQLEDIKKEQKALLGMRDKIIAREEEIREQLSSGKKLIKK